MIIKEFTFGNYKSFWGVNKLDLSAANIHSKDPTIDDANVIEKKGDDSVLKTKAIYGANASGKSNVIGALKAFISVVKDSYRDNSVFAYIQPFALSSVEQDQSLFQIVFFDDDVRYRYGFEANYNGTVLTEWLYQKTNREIPLFKREGHQISDINGKKIPEAAFFQTLLKAEKRHDGETKIEGLFLTLLASFAFGEVASRIVNLITSIKIVNGLDDDRYLDDAQTALQDERTKSFMVSFLKYADVGLDDIYYYEFSAPGGDDSQVKKKKETVSAILSQRTKYDLNGLPAGPAVFLSRSHESEGTIKMISLSPKIYQILRDGGVLVIDEFDARLHPLLTKKIVETFNSSLNTKAQLIFVTHDTNLLSADILRKDQIDFVEKDERGASHLYSLVDFKGVRNSAPFERDYVLGKYGAVPFLGDFSALNELLNDA